MAAALSHYITFLLNHATFPYFLFLPQEIYLYEKTQTLTCLRFHINTGVFRRYSPLLP